jgi:hypothetical protein
LKIHFEIHRADFGEGECRGRGAGGPFHSIAFFCYECGDVWARLRSSFHTNWRITGRICDKHIQREPFETPGTLFMKWEPQIEEAMPRAVLLREWSLHDRFNQPILETSESLARSECDAPRCERIREDDLLKDFDKSRDHTILHLHRAGI